MEIFFKIWCYVDNIRISQEIKCLLYAGFFLGQVKTKNLIFTQLIVIDDLYWNAWLKLNIRGNKLIYFFLFKK